MSDKQFESVVAMAQPYLETPYASLPVNLRRHVEAAFYPRPDFWDTYSTAQKQRQLDEYDLQINQTREIEHEAGWLDTHMDASAWWATESITPLIAAMLLSRMNPNTESVDDAQTTSSDEMEPEDFRRLRNTFEGASSPRKSLKEWISYARERRLKFHSWVTTWEGWVARVETANALATPPASTAAPMHLEPAITHSVDRTQPWLQKDPRDTQLERFEPWGTPARYFARQFVKNNDALRHKRLILAVKVVDSLAENGIKKRGGVKSPDPATILKAFSNLDFS